MKHEIFNWINTTLLEIGAKYPEKVATIANLIFNQEIADNEFLPGNMPTQERALCALPCLWGVKNKKLHLQKIQVARLFILNHRLGFHCNYPEQETKILDEMAVIKDNLKKQGYEFTKEELANFGKSRKNLWIFEPQKIAK